MYSKRFKNFKIHVRDIVKRDVTWLHYKEKAARLG